MSEPVHSCFVQPRIMRIKLYPEVVMRRRRTWELFFVLFVISFFSVSNAWAAGTYGGGDGSAGNPFQISTPAHMDEMHSHSEDWNKHFELTTC